MLQGLLRRDALDGVALQEVLEGRGGGVRPGQQPEPRLSPAPWTGVLTALYPCPWSPAAGPSLWH